MLILLVLWLMLRIFLLMLLMLWLMLTLAMLIDELFIDMLVEIWLLFLLTPAILVLIDKKFVLTILLTAVMTVGLSTEMLLILIEIE